MKDQIPGILAVLNEFAAAYRDRDAARYLASFAEPAFVYGTAADEKCRGLSEIRAHVERDWAQSTSASFTLTDGAVATAVATVALWLLPPFSAIVVAVPELTVTLPEFAAVSVGLEVNRST